jgi:hypothetical protein
MSSGWGDDFARSNWYANRDFNFRTLVCRKGEKLPSAWQDPSNVRYLKEQYGEGCIVRKTDEQIRAEMGQEPVNTPESFEEFEQVDVPEPRRRRNKPKQAEL